jgi:arylsulfatase A-like enzyme/thiamine biosynthesis lipoprotein ApbE
MFGTLLALLLAPQAAIEPVPERFEYSEAHMGTEFRLVLYADQKTQADAASRAAFARIGDLDAQLSDYQKTSELSKLNQLAQDQATDWVAVGEPLWRVLEASQRIAQLSDGAFDATLGSCVRLWRRAARQGELPSAEQLAAAKTASGWTHLHMNDAGHQVRISQPGLRLDLGGIAKGFALDEALQTLRAFGIQSALVDGGGDVAVSNPPPGRDGWKVMLSEGTWDGANHLMLANEALATSGDRYQKVILQGVSYSHIIDPATGLGLTQSRAASVRAKSAMEADAWASALCVMGTQKAAAALAAQSHLRGKVFEAEKAPAVEVYRKPRKPLNIVFILADDLGWNDLGCMGSDYYSTPNLDRLASEGMRFTSAYTAAANCAPTRAALMSGMYGPRTGIYTVGSGARGKAKDRQLVPVKNQTELRGSVVTLAESLQQAGYRTGHFGKWHLGGEADTLPESQGFEVNIAGTHAGHPPTYFWPYRRQMQDPENPGQKITKQQLPGLEEGTDGEYLTDRLTDEALQFLDADDDRPFFLYLPHYAVHTPIQAPRDRVWEWKKKPAGVYQKNATYAAMIESLDQNVGRILSKLDEMGVADQTLVIFYSDNGGLGGYRDANVNSGDVTHNAPLRGGKGMYYEGGIRVPLLMRLPGSIPAQSVQSTPVTTVDFYPTLMELSGAAAPEQVLDGRSLTPLWEPRKIGGQVPSAMSALKARPIFWHMPGYLEAKKGWRTTPVGAVRKGQYKLLEFFENGRLELYDLHADISERRNLADIQPELRDTLHAELQQWRQSVGAPMPPKK